MKEGKLAENLTPPCEAALRGEMCPHNHAQPGPVVLGVDAAKHTGVVLVGEGSPALRGRWPARDQLIRSLAVRRVNEVLRHVGLDPDGPELVPMRPASDWGVKAGADNLRARGERHQRDAWLRRALRFT
jgi:hypothetical protein